MKQELDFNKNEDQHKQLLYQLQHKMKKARLGGGEKKIESQHNKGKLTARERIELLLDEGSFEEFDKFVVHRSTDFGSIAKNTPAMVLSPVTDLWTDAKFFYLHRISPSLADRYRRPMPKRSARSWTWQ